MVPSPSIFKTFSLTLFMLTQNTQLSFRLTNCTGQLSISSSVCSLNFDNTHIGVRSEPLVLWISKLKCYLSGSHYNRRLAFTGVETLAKQQDQTTKFVRAPVPQRRLQLLCDRVALPSLRDWLSGSPIERVRLQLLSPGSLPLHSFHCYCWPVEGVDDHVDSGIQGTQDAKDRRSSPCMSGSRHGE